MPHSQADPVHLRKGSLQLIDGLFAAVLTEQKIECKKRKSAGEQQINVEQIHQRIRI